MKKVKFTCMNSTPSVPPALDIPPTYAGNAVARKTVMADNSNMWLTEVREDKAIEAVQMRSDAVSAADNELRFTSSCLLSSAGSTWAAATEGGVAGGMGLAGSPLSVPNKAVIGHREVGAPTEEESLTMGTGTVSTVVVVVVVVVVVSSKMSTSFIPSSPADTTGAAVGWFRLPESGVVSEYSVEGALMTNRNEK